MKNKFILINVILIAIISICTVSLGFSINIEMDKTEDLKINDEVILTINLSEKIIGASFKINYDIGSLKLLEKETQNLNVSENNGQIACVYIDMDEKGTDNLKIRFKLINTDKTDLNFSLEEAKFIALGNENSYLGDDIIGISKTITIEKAPNDNNSNTDDDTNNNQNNNENNNNNNGTNNNTGNSSNNIQNNNTNSNISTNNKTNNSNKNDNTTVKTSIPKTGTSDIILVFIGIIICSIVYFSIKLKNIKS